MRYVGKSFKRAATLLAVVATLAACSKLEPLTQEQKVVVKGLISGTGAPVDAVQQAQSTTTTTPTSKLNELASIFPFFLTPESLTSQVAEEGDENPTPAAQPTEDERRAQLKAAIRAQVKTDCSVEIPKAQNVGGGQDLKLIQMTVNGANCPLDIAMSVQVREQSSSSAEIYVSYRMTIQSAELLELSQVQGFSLEGSIKGNQSGASGQLVGSISSKDHGSVAWSMELDVNASGKGLAAIQLEPGFVARIEVRTDGQTAEYYINDVKSTEEEVQELIGGSALGV